MPQRTIYRWRRRTSTQGQSYQYVTASLNFPTNAGAAGYEAYDVRNTSGSDFQTSDHIINSTRTHVHISEIILHLRCRPDEWYGKAAAEQCNFRMYLFEDAYFDFTCIAKKDEQGKNIFYNYTFSSNDRTQLDNLEQILVDSENKTNYWSNHDHSVRFKSLDTYKYGLEIQSVDSMDDCNYVDIIYVDDSPNKELDSLSSLAAPKPWWLKTYTTIDAQGETTNAIKSYWDSDEANIPTTLYRCKDDTSYSLIFTTVPPDLKDINNAITGYVVVWNNYMGQDDPYTLILYSHTFVDEEWNFGNGQTYTAQIPAADWPVGGSFKNYMVWWLDAYGNTIVPAKWNYYTIAATLSTTKLALTGSTTKSINKTTDLWAKPGTTVSITAAKATDDSTVGVQYEYWKNGVKVNDFTTEETLTETTTFKEVITYTNLLCKEGESNNLVLEYTAHILTLDDLKFNFSSAALAYPYDVVNSKYYSSWTNNNLTGSIFLKGTSTNILLSYTPKGEWTDQQCGASITYKLQGQAGQTNDTLNTGEVGTYSLFKTLASGKDMITSVNGESVTFSPKVSGVAGQGQTITGSITLRYEDSDDLALTIDSVNILFVPTCDITKFSITSGLNSEKSIQPIANSVTLVWKYDLPAYAGRIIQITVQAENINGEITTTDFTEGYVVTNTLDYNAVSILNIQGGATFSLKLIFTDEFGNTTVEGKESQVIGEKTVPLSFIRVAMIGLTNFQAKTSGTPTTSNLELQFNIEKPATIANWEDIQYHYCLAWNGNESWTEWKNLGITASGDIASAYLTFSEVLTPSTLLTEFENTNFATLFQEDTNRCAYGILDGTAEYPVTVCLQARDRNKGVAQEESIGTTVAVPITLDYRQAFDNTKFSVSYNSNLQDNNKESVYTSLTTATFTIVTAPTLQGINNDDSLTKFSSITLERNGEVQNQFEATTNKATYTFPVLTENATDRFVVRYVYTYADGSTTEMAEEYLLDTLAWVPPTGVVQHFLLDGENIQSRIQMISLGTDSGLTIKPKLNIVLATKDTSVGPYEEQESTSGIKNWTFKAEIDTKLTIGVNTLLTPTITVSYTTTSGEISQSVTLSGVAVRARSTVPLGIRQYGIGINMPEDGDIEKGEPALQVTQDQGANMALLSTNSSISTILVGTMEHQFQLNFDDINGLEIYIKTK